jgi:PIN domain nuclease of toxin-antitoxin system
MGGWSLPANSAAAMLPGSIKQPLAIPANNRAGAIESSVRAMVDQTSVIVHEITPELAALATAFSADRLIAATARSSGMALVTRDQRILESGLLKLI